jgi:arabinan endo-1,5-alpha-L-arabinosidase
MKPFVRLMSSSAMRGAALIVVAATIAGCSASAIDVLDLDPGTLQEGLIAHWSFDDPGTMLTDSTANHYDGTLLTGATWIAGQPGFGGALHFDGSDQSEVDVLAFPQPSASWSVAGWIRAPAGDTGTTYDTIVSTEVPNSGGWQLNLGLAPAVLTNPMNTVSLYQYAYSKMPAGAYSFANCNCFVPDTWVHIAGVFDADQKTISIYRNGTFAASQAQEPKIELGSDTLFFGRWGFDSTRRLIGDLDDFVVYNRALSSPEIRQLARAPLPATTP